MFIIMGTRQRVRIIGNGQFQCPGCQAERAYARKEARPYFTLYFVPLFPVGKPVEYIECLTCGRTFELDVLDEKRKKVKRTLAERINAIGDDLRDGMPVEYLVRDLTMDGIERSVAQQMVTSAIGETRRRCASCNLTYAAAVETCSECEQPLSEVMP